MFSPTILTSSAVKKQRVSLYAVSSLMLLKETTAVYFRNRKKPTNALCGQNSELLNVKTGGTYSYHPALKI
jgi:hypothetical protein